MPRYSGPERRRFKRIATSLPVKYGLGSGKCIHKTHTIDISEGGVRLGPVPLSNEWMLGTCSVDLEISLPHAENPVKARAEVVRVEESPRPHHIHHRCRHNVRLKFCEITEEARKQIREFINKF